MSEEVRLVKISDQMRDMLKEFARYQGAYHSTNSPSLIDYEIDRFLEWYSVQLNKRLKNEKCITHPVDLKGE